MRLASTEDRPSPIRQVSVDRVVPNPEQPRTVFDPESIASLAESIRSKGLLQPIIIRPLNRDQYAIIAGERRWNAAKKAGLKEIPAIISDVSDRKESLILAMIENLQREDLNPIDEAASYDKLSKEYQLSHDEIASTVGKSRVSVTNAIRLLSLPMEVIESIKSGKLSPGQARPLLSIDDKNKTIDLYNRILSLKLSARDVEKLVAEYLQGRNGGAKKKTREKEKNIHQADVEDRLMKRFGRSVKISGTEKKGFIRIDFYSKQDLIDLVDQLLGQ